MLPCSLVNSYDHSRTYCIHLQGRRPTSQPAKGLTRVTSLGLFSYSCIWPHRWAQQQTPKGTALRLTVSREEMMLTVGKWRTVTGAVSEPIVVGDPQVGREEHYKVGSRDLRNINGVLVCDAGLRYEHLGGIQLLTTWRALSECRNLSVRHRKNLKCHVLCTVSSYCLLSCTINKCLAVPVSTDFHVLVLLLSWTFVPSILNIYLKETPAVYFLH
jgi:hypothetical protein